ncbi:MAG: hypothetical protein MUC73_03505 [Cyclobacteriaceae bacterium]|jgi:hypothetical protein|nr:hypothetical protein [Cyclobacteriaceae bacterium]
MVIRKWQTYFMLVAIAGMIIILLTVGKTSDICKMHEELFHAHLTSGVVINKFLDKENHSFETVVIQEGDKSFTLLLVPDANDKDFEHIKVKDKITKNLNSFRFVVNGEYEFEFQIDCNYEH